MTSVSQSILNSFKHFIPICDDEIEKIGTRQSPLPSFSITLLNELIQLSIKRLTVLPNVLHINGDVVIVGDLHGNIIDLIRVLSHAGLNRKFLFLGDYVDRGEYSLEVIVLLLSLMIER